MHPAVALDADLDRYVESFEAARRRGAVDLAGFLPAPGHPLYLPVLRELVCVDLDYGWGGGEPTSLGEYRRRFAALFADVDTARAVVWEDYRQRRQAGEEPDPEDYRREFGIVPASVTAGDEAAGDDEDGPPTQVVDDAGLVAPPMAGSDEQWVNRLDGLGTGRAASGPADLYHATHRTNPAAAERYARVMVGLPQVGEMFAGFRLEAELGRGAFGRVFLARQVELADRQVALKVSAEPFGEAQTMARLVHTNIVPIYSPHKVGPVHAVCMPYLGGTTLADVFKALGGKALPASGKHIVSTLHGRKQSTVRSATSHLSSAKSGDGSPSAAGLSAAGLSKPGFADPGHRTGEDAPTTEALAALERLSYPEAVLWLGARLADALAYAHERGIVHRDLKPANILLTDDGQPMLIDFNLADNSALRNSETGARVGGTLPYMAPEQLRAFQKTGERRLDGRTDVYSLGLILFELLTGTTAYPHASARGPEGLAKMLADRSGPPPRLRTVNPAVSPAAEAIVRKCLEPDLEKRYQSARDLHDDIERHLSHLPLKHTPEPSARERFVKWQARHPRLSSGTAVTIVAAAALAAVGTGAFALHREVRRSTAADEERALLVRSDAVLPGLIRSLDADRRGTALDTARQTVARYGVFDRPDWQAGPLLSYLPSAERDRVRGRVGELLFIMAQAALDQPADAGHLRAALDQNDRAAACFAPADRRACWEQRAALLTRLGDAAAAANAAAEAGRLEHRTPSDCYLRGVHLYHEGKFAEALPLLERATAGDDHHYCAWFLRGNCHYFRGQDTEAVRCYSICISLDSAHPQPYFNRARVGDRLKDFGQAVADADRAVELSPDWVEARIAAALARYRFALALAQPDNIRASRDELFAKAGEGLPKDQQKILRQAEEQLTAILRQPDAPARCYFHRADVRRILGDKAGAAADMEAGFAHEPAADDDRSWVVRGLKCFEVRNKPDEALADLRRAAMINPHSHYALQNESHVLMETGRSEENLAVLDRLIDRYPELVEARAGRAVQLARLGRTEEAVAEAAWVKAHSADPMLTYQMAGVYALTGDTRQSLRLLADALLRGAGHQYLKGDPDLAPIRERPEFQKLLDAVRTLQQFLASDARP